MLLSFYLCYNLKVLFNTLVPIFSPISTLVSYPSLVCSIISLSISTIFFLKNKITVEPPNLKYPFSSPLETLFPGGQL